MLSRLGSCALRRGTSTILRGLGLSYIRILRQSSTTATGIKPSKSLQLILASKINNKKSLISLYSTNNNQPKKNPHDHGSQVPDLPESPHEEPINPRTVDPEPPMTVDVDLPDVESRRRSRRIALAIYLTVMTIIAGIAFNYERVSSPIVSSTLFALRQNPKARDLLGQGIVFKSTFPWIHGELSLVTGKVDLEYAVKGSKDSGTVHFAASRDKFTRRFVMLDWSLTLNSNGQRIDLSEDEAFHPLIPEDAQKT